MSGSSPLDHLVEWYSRQCDGDWEHEYGIEIRTLDNPGWFIRVNLTGTELEGKSVPRTTMRTDETDWLDYQADGEIFTAAGGTHCLPLLLAKFQEFGRSAVDEER